MSSRFLSTINTPKYGLAQESAAFLKSRAALYRKNSSAGGICFKMIVVNNVNEKLDKLSNKRALVKINH